MTHFQPWELAVQAACTIGIFSFLYRENKTYRFFAHLLLGLGVGVSVGAAWTGILQPKWWDRLPVLFERASEKLPWYSPGAWDTNFGRFFHEFGAGGGSA